MPNITLDIFARLHQTTLRRTEKEAQQRFQQLGQKAADQLTQGIEKAAPRIRRAMSSAADATVDYTRKTRDLSKAQKEHAAAADRVVKLEANVADQYARNAALAQEVARGESAITQARKSEATQTRGIATREANLRAKRSEHLKTAEALRKKELQLKQIRLDQGSKAAIAFEKTFMDLQRQNAAEIAYNAKKYDELKAARVELGRRTEAVSRIESDLKDVRKEQSSSVKELDDTEKDLLKTRQSASKQGQDLVRLNEDFVKSTRKREEAIRQLAETEAAEEKRRATANGGNRKKRGGIGVVGNMLTDLPFVPSGPAGAVMGSGVIVTLASAAEAAVTASQALAVLPAVAAAGAAAIGTLAMGFNGFGDALKHMGDPKKWAQDLATLSPAAQQAALEIQYLVDGPLGDLQDATQETLFSGVAEQLHTLTDNLLPEAQTLTQGISQSFNNMFDNAVGQILSPQSQASIGVVIDNIVTSFQKLEPAVAPFISAITKITETGSSFLPGFADAITNAANSFNTFITTAQQNGSLAEFIQKGIDAAKALGDIIWDIGQRIYAVFGNKDPGEFKQTLDSMVDAAFAVANAIVGISHVVNDLMGPTQAVADAIGGWENVIKLAAGAFVVFKLAGLTAASELATGLATAGTGAGLGFAGKVAAALKGFGWAALGAAIAIPILSELDRKVNEWGNSHGQPTPPGEKDRLIPRGVPILPFWEDQFRNVFGDDPAPAPQVFGPPHPGGNAPGAPGPRHAPITGVPGMPPIGAPGAGTDTGLLGDLDVDKLGTADYYKTLYPQPAAPPPPAGLPGYHPFDVPAPPPEGPKVSDKDRRDAIRAGLPADFGAVDPFGPMGGPTPGSMPMMPQSSGGPLNLGQLLTGAAGLPNSGTGSVGGGVVDPQKVYEANNRVQSEAWDVQDAARDLEVLKRDNLATQEEIVAADHKLTEQKWQLQGAQADLVKAQQGSKGSGSGSKLSAGLDNDLGASRGLAGLADNLVRLVGALGTAPLMNQLQGIVDADPNKGGFGLMGILGAQGAFGPRFTGQQSGLGAPAAASSSAMASGASYGAPAGTAMPGESPRDFAHRVMMPYWQSQGLTVGDHGADKYGEHQNGALDIMVPSIAEGSKVLQQVLSDPNVYGAIFNQRSYGYGHGTAGTPMEDRGSPTQNHQDHVHAFYKPGGANNIAPQGMGPAAMAGGIPAMPASIGAGLPIPLPVIIVGGAAPAAVMPGGVPAPGAPPGVPGAPPPSTSPVPGAPLHAGMPPAPGAPPPVIGMPGTGAGPLPGPTGWASPNLPAGMPGGGGEGPMLGSNPAGPGAGASAGAPPIGGPQQGPVGKGAGTGGWQPQGGGGIGPSGGGAIGMAMDAGSMALDVMAPGSGQAAQTAMKLVNRSIQYGGQLASVGVGGLLETFGLSDTELGDPSKSWLGRAASGIAGAAPAVPTTAGQSKPPAEPPKAEGQQQGGQQGPTVSIGQFVQAPNRNGQQTAKDLAAKAHGAWTKP